MTLFDDTLLFDEGKKRYTNFELPDADLKLWEQFFQKDESDNYYKILLKESPWKQHTRKMYDRMIPDPRLTAWYGSESSDAWPFTLLEIKERVEHECEIVFNSVLLNYYRDGNDSVAWHSDTLPSQVNTSLLRLLLLVKPVCSKSAIKQIRHFHSLVFRLRMEACY